MRAKIVDVQELSAGTTEERQNHTYSWNAQAQERERDACAHTCAVSPFARACAVPYAVPLA